MKTTLMTLAFCLVALCLNAQNDPISLEYAIGSFKIPSQQDQKISQRFGRLDPNKTYIVTIVGSADFLGSEDNNRTLSNKRVKFAEYHLLQHYSNYRLIIKLDSKGELRANGPQTRDGIQEHRTVHIYVDEYNAHTNTAAQSSEEVAASGGRMIVTGAAAQAETTLRSTPVYRGSQVSTPKEIKPISETAQIEIAKQEAEAARQRQFANPNTTTLQEIKGPTIQSQAELQTSLATGNPASGTLKTVDGDQPARRFEGEGAFTVGEKLLLSDMNFRPGSHYLRPSSIPQLRKLIAVLEANPNLEIEIIGHICCHPVHSPHPDAFDREAGNHMLSFNRANNIKEYLEKNGIDGGRITAKGMGAKERLVFPEETDQDRIKNRRVEIRITAL